MQHYICWNCLFSFCKSLHRGCVFCPSSLSLHHSCCIIMFLLPSFHRTQTDPAKQSQLSFLLLFLLILYQPPTLMPRSRLDQPPASLQFQPVCCRPFWKTVHCRLLLNISEMPLFKACFLPLFSFSLGLTFADFCLCCRGNERDLYWRKSHSDSISHAQPPLCRSRNAASHSVRPRASLVCPFSQRFARCCFLMRFTLLFWDKLFLNLFASFPAEEAKGRFPPVAPETRKKLEEITANGAHLEASEADQQFAIYATALLSFMASQWVLQKYNQKRWLRFIYFEVDFFLWFSFKQKMFRHRTHQTK